MLPNAGDLTKYVPDPLTLLTAIMAVGVVSLGVYLAIAGYKIVAEHFKFKGN